jgi:hypothetical protein
MLVRSKKTCVSEGESPSSLETRLPEFGTNVIEWKSLTNCPRPRIDWRKENRWTYGTSGSNDRREAYSGKSASRKDAP